MRINDEHSMGNSRTENETLRLRLDNEGACLNVMELPTSNRKLNFAKIRQIAPLHFIIITVVLQTHIVSSVFEFFYSNVHTMFTVKKRLTLDALAPSHAIHADCGMRNMSIT